MVNRFISVYIAVFLKCRFIYTNPKTTKTNRFGLFE